MAKKIKFLAKMYFKYMLKIRCKLHYGNIFLKIYLV